MLIFYAAFLKVSFTLTFKKLFLFIAVANISRLLFLSLKGPILYFLPESENLIRLSVIDVKVKSASVGMFGWLDR